MESPDDQTPNKKLIVVGPFTRPVCFRKAPITEEESRLQGRITTLEAELREAKQVNTDAERAFQREIVEERLADLPSNEAVFLARATLAKNELAKEQRRSKQVAAEADSRVQQKQLEMEEQMKRLEADWRDRLERRYADIDQLRARNRWLWDELRAAQDWIRRLEAPSSSRTLQLGAQGLPIGGALRESRRETEVRIQVLDRQFAQAAPNANEFNALIDNIDGIIRTLRREKEELAHANQTLESQLKVLKDHIASSNKEMSLMQESRESYREHYTQIKEHAKYSLLQSEEMKARAEAAEAEVQRLQAAEAKREKEKISAGSKVEGMDVGDAYFLGFDECKALAEMLCPGIGKDLRYPLDAGAQRGQQIREGTRGAGTLQEPIDLNDSPPNL